MQPSAARKAERQTPVTVLKSRFVEPLQAFKFVQSVQTVKASKTPIVIFDDNDDFERVKISKIERIESLQG